jgi:hypothetical protein
MSDLKQLTETFASVIDTYEQRAIEFCKEQGLDDVSEHITKIMVSIMMTRDNVLLGGSFVKSIVDNRLYEAVSFADKECYQHLKLLVLTNKHCYLHYE